MKKNKNKKQGLALVGVLLMCGYVFKSKFGFFDSNSSEEVVSYQEHFFQLKKYSKDTFKLDLPIRDPFLGGKSYTTSINHSSKQNTNPNNYYKPNNSIQPNIVKSTVWPQIAYYGYVKNKSKGKKQACLVKINSTVNKMFLGDKINDILLTSIYKDSIIVRFGKEVKTIKKK